MKRKTFRLFFYSIKAIVGLFIYIDARLYMRTYLPLLKMAKLRINGTPRFIAKSVSFDDFDKISIGDRLVVSSNVNFLTHDYSYTTALISAFQKPKTDIGIIRTINVGSNVFIGMNSIILPGTILGNNIIVGAGSVVRGSFPDNVVISGNPAKIICTIQEYLEKCQNRKLQEFRVDRT